jgi:hypothetical protein
MKKSLPYIITVLVVGLLVTIIIAANNRRSQTMDERITLREKDKINYGMSAAREFCSSLFPNAVVTVDDNPPGGWKNISWGSGKQAVILMSGYFNADEFDLNQILKFVERGNYVFIIGRGFSHQTENFFHFSYSAGDFSELLTNSADSLSVHLERPAFSSDSIFVYPGKRFEGWFNYIDNAHSVVLGSNDSFPNFIRMDKGSGSVFIHSAPLAFSNYFILHKNNIHYFEQAMSVIPSDVEAVVWNEYYLKKKNQSNGSDGREPNWLGVLLRHPEFKWGFLVIILTAALWILLNSRRRQRMIPVHAKPRNDSLDFVKTMGRLYYVRKDHHDLARKMAIYFLEHVRSTYKLPTHTLDEQFTEALAYKSGFSRTGIDDIISFINHIRINRSISDPELTGFHNQLEAFYQNT